MTTQPSVTINLVDAMELSMHMSHYANIIALAGDVLGESVDVDRLRSAMKNLDDEIIRQIRKDV